MWDPILAKAAHPNIAATILIRKKIICLTPLSHALYNVLFAVRIFEKVFYKVLGTKNMDQISVLIIKILIASECHIEVLVLEIYVRVDFDSRGVIF